MSFKIENITELKTIPGIDTLYYFCETNGDYPVLFDYLQGSIKEKREMIDIIGEDNSIAEMLIEINGYTLNYIGKAEGFLWFIDTNALFKIGFKDSISNMNLNDIRVQLLSNGIYSIGIKRLISYIDNMLEGFISDNKPITRADLNSFVQLDLSFINENMFSTRKRDMEIRKKLKSNIMQTIYVGKKPFLLRIYNKKEELANTHKEKLMKIYFKENGFDYEKPIFNVEFELHRQFLRTFHIDTVEDLLENAVQLFHNCIEAIRLIDNSTLTDTNRYRASTHPIWIKIGNDYSIDQFIQSESILEKIKRKQFVYELEDFKSEFKALSKRAIMYSLPITPDLMKSYYDETRFEVGRK